MGITSLTIISLSVQLVATFPADGPKREKPEVLTPVEFRTAVVRAGIRSYMLTADHGSIMVRYGKPNPGHGFIPIDQLARRSDIRPLDKVLPVRMTIVVGSFPYRRQLEEIRHALHLTSLDEAQKEMHFAGFDIERRSVRPDGKPAGKWDKAAIEENYSELARFSGRRYVEEDRSLKAVIFTGLVVGLPERLDGIRYPRPENRLPLLKQSLAKIGSAVETTPREAPAENPFEKKIEKEALKPNPTAIPDYCLTRFMDVTVEPGQSYEYRFKVRMRNPNFKRAKDIASPELAKSEHVSSEWVYVPGQIGIPADFSFYAIDQRELNPRQFADAKRPNRDETVVQLHRWLDWAGRELWSGAEPIGDWAIAERVLVRAGEYIGGSQEVELPIWSWLGARFVLASNPADRSNSRIAIPFTDEQEIAPLLVDYKGGDLGPTGIHGRLPRELLILMPNGRLIVRNSAADELSPDRREHYDHWRRRVEKIKATTQPKSLGSERLFP
jgi:hypothetical protein